MVACTIYFFVPRIVMNGRRYGVLNQLTTAPLRTSTLWLEGVPNIIKELYSTCIQNVLRLT